MLLMTISYGISVIILVAGLATIWYFINAELHKLSNKTLQSLKVTIGELKSSKFTAIDTEFDRVTDTKGIVKCLKYAGKNGFRLKVAEANTKIANELTGKVVKKLETTVRSIRETNNKLVKSTTAQIRNHSTRKRLTKQADEYVLGVLAPIVAEAEIVKERIPAPR